MAYSASPKQLRVFDPKTGLHQYLAKRKSNLITLTVGSYRLSTILLALKEIIEEEALCDPLNRSIILLNPELERIFGTKAFHVSQFRLKLENLLYRKYGREINISLDIANKEIEAMNFWISAEGETELEKPTLIGEIGPIVKVNPELVIILRSKGFIPRKAGCLMRLGKVHRLVNDYVEKTVPRDARNPWVKDLRRNELGRLLNINFATPVQISNKINDLITYLPEPTRKSQRLP